MKEKEKIIGTSNENNLIFSYEHETTSPSLLISCFVILLVWRMVILINHIHMMADWPPEHIHKHLLSFIIFIGSNHQFTIWLELHHPNVYLSNENILSSSLSMRRQEEILFFCFKKSYQYFPINRKHMIDSWHTTENRRFRTLLFVYTMSE